MKSVISLRTELKFTRGKMPIRYSNVQTELSVPKFAPNRNGNNYKMTDFKRIQLMLLLFFN